MAISTRDGLIAALAGGPVQPFYKPGVGSQTSGRLASYWRSAGQPTTGTTPTTSAVCNNTTTGALPLGTLNGTNVWYMAGAEMTSSVAQAMVVCDRLVHHGNASGTVTTAQTVGTTIPSRAGNGDGVQAYVEIYTATGATGVNATISYTNQSGTAGRTSGAVAIPSSPGANNLFGPFPLQTGDTGIQSVQSVTLSATTGTAGAFGITLLRRVAGLNISAANGFDRIGYSDISLPLLGTDPCLFMVALATATTTGNLLGSIAVAQG